MSKGKTIDEFIGQPKGSFKKWIENEKKKLAKIEQERKDRIRKRRKMLKLILKFWKWPQAIKKLAEIREISSIYYNDSKFNKITKIIDR